MVISEYQIGNPPGLKSRHEPPLDAIPDPLRPWDPYFLPLVANEVLRLSAPSVRRRSGRDTDAPKLMSLWAVFAGVRPTIVSGPFFRPYRFMGSQQSTLDPGREFREDPGG